MLTRQPWTILAALTLRPSLSMIPAVDRVLFGQEIGRLLAAQKDNPRANIVHGGFDLFAFHSFAERVKAR
jgi:hypothetical protein